MLIAVVGQTASGKSDLGIDLAAHLGGASGAAVVGMDAMQLYRGLDVGTAKTPLLERRGIPHYQMDRLSISQEASVARYQTEARRDVAELDAGGRQVVAVGGSGLYVRALLDVMTFPGTDAAVRARLQAEAEADGAAALHQRLQGTDPEAAARIHPHNVRRVVRALEVIEVTGRPFTAFLPEPSYFFPRTVQFAIAWDERELDARIDSRTQMMFAGGILEETAELIAGGETFGKTAARATGYAEALAVNRGELSADEAVARVALATRQLARSQRKWFRKDPRIHWLNPSASEPLLQQALAVIDP